MLDAGARSTAALARIIPTTGSAARTVETRFALPANAAGAHAARFVRPVAIGAECCAQLPMPRVAVKTDVNGNYLWVGGRGREGAKSGASSLRQARTTTTR